MKRILRIIFCLIFLCGCSSEKEALDFGHNVRSNILRSNGCSFVAEITADYGDEIYEFKMQCDFDRNGELKFKVISPESISGITGKVEAEQGAFTFDDQMLAFNVIADGQITPVTAPWVLMKALRGGYIAACSKEKNGYYLQLDDSYVQDPLTVDVWFNELGDISYGEFLWDGRRILSIKVSNYKIL